MSSGALTVWPSGLKASEEAMAVSGKKHSPLEVDTHCQPMCVCPPWLQLKSEVDGEYVIRAPKYGCCRPSLSLASCPPPHVFRNCQRPQAPVDSSLFHSLFQEEIVHSWCLYLAVLRTPQNLGLCCPIR